MSARIIQLRKTAETEEDAEESDPTPRKRCAQHVAGPGALHRALGTEIETINRRHRHPHLANERPKPIYCINELRTYPSSPPHPCYPFTSNLIARTHVIGTRNDLGDDDTHVRKHGAYMLHHHQCAAQSEGRGSHALATRTLACA